MVPAAVASVWWIVHMGLYWGVACWIADPQPPTMTDVPRVVVQNQLAVTMPWFFLIAHLLPYTTPVTTPVQLLAAPILLDFAFYGLHRAAHHKALFTPVHALHHTVRAPYAAAAAYCTPLEHLVVNLLSGSIPPLLLGFTPLLTGVWIALGTIDVVVAHSRYSQGHDVHHTRPTKRFGSSLGIADRLFGTR